MSEPIVEARAVGGRRHTCPWCGHASDGASLSCPACGAPVDVQAVVNEAGWCKMPGARDMARVHFGQSTCQIEGAYVPVADFNLAAGDTVYFAHHLVLWKDVGVDIRAQKLAGAWKRLLSGMPLVMTEAQGPGRIAFSRDVPGELVVIPLEPGKSVDVREHVFMVATGGVDYTWFNPDVWVRTRNGDEYETHHPLGMLMDRFIAPREPGLLLLHGAGNLFMRELKAGEHLLVRPRALLYKDSSVRMQLHLDYVKSNSTSFLSDLFGTSAYAAGDSRHLWVRLTGPGRVAVQSADKHEEETSLPIDSTSACTFTNW